MDSLDKILKSKTAQMVSAQDQNWQATVDSADALTDQGHANLRDLMFAINESLGDGDPQKLRKAIKNADTDSLYIMAMFASQGYVQYIKLLHDSVYAND